MTKKITDAVAKPPRRKLKPTTAPRAAAGATTARVEQLRLQVLQMTNAGMSCADIGGVLGLGRQRVHGLLREELEEIRTETQAEGLEWRIKLTQRHESRLAKLDTIIARTFADDASKVPDDLGARIAALGKAKDIDVELGKLWGAYAPVRNELTGPNGGPLEAGVFAVAMPSADPRAWTAAALAQSDGEEAEADRLLNTRPPALAAIR